ncbi:hypothetical protein DFH08DRAFT_803822 [Mycena albidolilacea]|uniref:Uncharacterized protein n=1 Tax=Mycena albidolilacea TaxID=1033008 RepID=A0AAD7EWK8_9AGAR|nr:hypothetical protein DFH08DRAFT_803822 [Mycena albidolilacea]
MGLARTTTTRGYDSPFAACRSLCRVGLGQELADPHLPFKAAVQRFSCPPSRLFSVCTPIHSALVGTAKDKNKDGSEPHTPRFFRTQNWRARLVWYDNNLTFYSPPRRRWCKDELTKPGAAHCSTSVVLGGGGGVASWARYRDEGWPTSGGIVGDRQIPPQLWLWEGKVVLKSSAVEIIDRVRKSREVGWMDYGAYCDRRGLTGVFGVHWMSEVGSSNDTEANNHHPNHYFAGGSAVVRLHWAVAIMLPEGNFKLLDGIQEPNRVTNAHNGMTELTPTGNDHEKPSEAIWKAPFGQDNRKFVWSSLRWSLLPNIPDASVS